jgi:hypothetical protein
MPADDALTTLYLLPALLLLAVGAAVDGKLKGPLETFSAAAIYHKFKKSAMDS